MLPTHGQAASLNLGTLAPDVATVELMVRNRISKTGRPLLLFGEFCAAVAKLPRLEQDARQNRQDIDRARGLDDDADEPLTWDEHDPRGYEKAKKERATARREADRAWAAVVTRGEISSAVATLIAVGTRVQLTPDFDGWMRYLHASGPFKTALADPKYQRSALFHESGLEESCLVVAPKKWGKSELLKALIYHHVAAPYDKAPAAAVVVLDPGTDLALQIARWPELSGADRARDRLVYVEPDLREGLTVGVNPLDGSGLGHRDRDKVAGMLVEAIGSLVADLSLAMRNLIRACCLALLWMPGSTLRTLQTMLSDPAEEPRAKALCVRACAYPDSADVRDFFRVRFMSDTYKGTKGYLLNRLDEVMLTHDLAGMFGGEAKVDLRAAIEARKVVLFNLGKLENEGDVTLAGRLLVTMVAAIARKRAQNAMAARTPIILVIDEVTMLAGGELVRAIAQLRKFGLHLILAQQVMGSGWSADDKRTVIENTGCKFIGGRDRRLLTEMLASVRDAGQTLPPIERTQFWVEWPETGGPHLLNVRDDLAGWHRYSVTDDEWAGYVDQATDPLSGYYRPAMPEVEPTPETISHGSHVPTSVGTLEPGEQENIVPPNVEPVEAVKIGLKRPPRRNQAKPVDLLADVGAARPKPRKKTPSKPLADAEKTPEVKKSRRKLD